ncbi:MAG: hypothetical protein M3130_09730 [Actinomycetota bacterium]|nr:hypothetical protein [Actinomycetota bacterium]
MTILGSRQPRARARVAGGAVLVRVGRDDPVEATFTGSAVLSDETGGLRG